MPREVIGVLNSGSASIKFALFAVDGDQLCPMLKGQIEGIYTKPHFISKTPSGVQDERFWDDGVKLGHQDATEYLLTYLRNELAGIKLLAVGHRVVHGGVAFTHPVLVDRDVLSALEHLIPLAPLHQPYNLAPLYLALDRIPQLPQIACFDTEFHRTIPEVAQMFALPAEFQEEGLRRYGFHGLSYEFISSQLPQTDSVAAKGKTIVLHLGNGASMCALQSGRSVATTMGFTAVDGLVMGTRCGSIDPGVLLYLMDQRGMHARAIEKLVYQQSGLLGISGLSSDMRILLNSSQPRAKLAIDLFIHRIDREMGALAASLNGLDAIVFTGGIGENSSPIRERICHDAGWLGVELDSEANKAGQSKISSSGSRVAVWVIPTNEELMIAQHTLEILRATSATAAEGALAPAA